jgi:hypothetical protein
VFYMDTVSILQQRYEFLEGVKETARLCNWDEERIEELGMILLKEVIKIDNLLFDTYEATQNRALSVVLWNDNMEDLRHWLKLILGIQVKFV